MSTDRRRRVTVLRRIALAAALVVVALPGNGRGWFGLPLAPPTVGTSWGSLHRGVLGTAPHALPQLRALPTPTSWPDPYVAPPTTVPVAVPVTEPLVAAVPEPVAPEPEAPPAPRVAPPPAVIAQLPRQGVAVYAGPDAPQPSASLDGVTEFDTPRVLLTTLASPDTGDRMIEVYLPTRPNGATGWIRREAVTLTTVPDRITVDLAARTVTWERGADVVGVVEAAVGADRSPTPTGTYFVTDVLPYSQVGAASARGQYGAWVVALNGHSEAFTTFDGGDARIAIHGTNAPASIGDAASSGCVRIADAPLDNLARNVPLGTPVVIHP